ncbi:MAG: hypothetical protein ACRD6X_15490 [Pyrinomonadaceae bacterium]
MNSPNATPSACHLLFRTLLVAIFLIGLLTQTFGQATPGQAFVEFKLNGLGSLLIPDTMELQGGAYKKLSDGYSKDLGYDVSGEVIFQQKGLNEFNFKDNKTYARVMIGTEIGTPDSFQKLSAKIKATPRELEIFGSAFKKEMVESFGNTGLRLVRWDGASVVTINGQSALKFAYLRQLNDNPSVYVEIYSFQNNDRMHRLTISYRLQDATLWKDALERTRNSFKITNIR